MKSNLLKKVTYLGLGTVMISGLITSQMLVDNSDLEKEIFNEMNSSVKSETYYNNNNNNQISKNIKYHQNNNLKLNNNNNLSLEEVLDSEINNSNLEFNNIDYYNYNNINHNNNNNNNNNNDVSNLISLKEIYEKNNIDNIDEYKKRHLSNINNFENNIKRVYNIGKDYFKESNLSVDFNELDIYSLIFIESTFDENKINQNYNFPNDYGLMQVNEVVNNDLNRIYNLNESSNYFFSETQKMLKDFFTQDDFNSNRFKETSDNSKYNIKAGISYLFMINEYFNKINSLDFNSLDENTKLDLIMWAYNRGPYEVENRFINSPNNWLSSMPYNTESGNIRQDSFYNIREIYKNFFEFNDNQKDNPLGDYNLILENNNFN